MEERALQADLLVLENNDKVTPNINVSYQTLYSLSFLLSKA